MSFLKNLRSSVSRKNSVRSKTENSIIEKNKNNISNENCDKNSNLKHTVNKKTIIEESENSEGVVRCNTYTIVDENGRVVISENREIIPTSTSPKKTMFSKFGTFTRRKKSKSQNKEIDVKDEILNTNKNLKNGNNDDILTNSSDDPFNIFYQQSTIVHPKKSSDRDSIIEYGTYRKSKLPNDVKKQLDDLHLEAESAEKSYDDNTDDKYKTVTIKTFRKSFRDQFLTQQKEAPYNPSWFIEVDKVKNENKEKESEIDGNTKQILVFENENYRPSARSPIRNLEKSPTRSKTLAHSPSRRSSNTSMDSRSRSTTRSPLRKTRESVTSYKNTTSAYQNSQHKPNVSIKRNETFRIEQENSSEPSIRIEIKNSISPNEPGRIVPVGVAKPIPFNFQNNNNQNNSYHIDLNSRYDRSSLNDRNRNYQTSIHIRESQPNNISNHYQERSENYSTLRLPISSRTQPSSKPTGLSSQSTIRTTKPIVENYLPLTSYELLTKIKPRSTIQNQNQNTNTNLTKSNVIKESTKFSNKFTQPRNADSHTNKKQNESLTTGNINQEKTSFYIADNKAAVCKDVSNQKGSNKKRLRIKLPWR